MERILRILILVAVLGGGGAILRRSPLIHRYGGPNKRPAAPQQYFAPQQPPRPVNNYPQQGGGYVAPPFGQNYGSSYNNPSVQNYGSPRPIAYNAPPSGPPRPAFDLPSVSYTRPFGLPQAPNSAYTYKLPKDPPPRIPMKSNYQSKPYPDYIVRFKSPLYPSELTVVSNPQQQPNRPAAPTVYAAPPSGPTAVYSGKAPAKSPIPIIDSVSGYVDQQNANVGINVGTSYQTDGNSGSQFPSSSPTFGQSPIDPSTIFNNGGAPPSTSIFVLTTSDFASDKLQSGSETGSGGLQISATPNLEISKDANSFGATAEPGVIKALTPDVVYRPDSAFKPLTLVGPVFFPKTEGEGEGSSGAASEQKETPSADGTVDCAKTGSASNPQCQKTVDSGKQIPDSSTTAAPAASSPTTTSTTEAPSSVDASAETPTGGSGGKSSSLETSATPVKSSKRPKSKLRLFRIINGIRELITGGDDESEGSSRVDEEEEDLGLDGGDLAEEEEEAAISDEGDKSDHREDSDVDATGDAEPKRPARKRKQKNKRKSSSKNSASGDRDRPRRPVESGSDGDLIPGLDVREDELRYVPNREQYLNRDQQESGDQQQFQGGAGQQFQGQQFQGGAGQQFQGQQFQGGAGFVPGQTLDDGRQDGSNMAGGADPILGPVSVGYIGPPPTGSDYHNLQPFFYPAGIPVYPQSQNENAQQSSLEPNQGFEADHTQRGDQVNSNAQLEQGEQPGRRPQNQEQKFENTRRYFENEEQKENDVVSRDPINKQMNSDLLPPAENTRDQQSATYDGPFSPDNNQPSNDRNFDENNNGGQQQNYGPKDQGRDHYEESFDNFEAGSSHQPSRINRPTADEKPTSEVETSDNGDDRQNDVLPPPAVPEQEAKPFIKESSTDSSYDGTYPETNSYSVDSDVTETTAYADHHASAGSSDDAASAYHNDYDHPSAQTTSYLHVDQDIAASATDSATTENNLNEDKQSGDRTNIFTAAIANQNEPLLDQEQPEAQLPAETEPETASLTPAKSYAVVSRRPFPSFSRYRGGYRFKHRDSDIPITTYRPAAFRTKASDKVKDEDVASIHNSLNYDESSSTTVSPNDLSEPVAMDTIQHETLIQSPAHVDTRYGSRLNTNQNAER